jgi:SAM-dependent methyltransferase
MRFDFGETFGEDYLYFSAGRLTDEQSDRDTDDIVRVLDLRAGEAVLDAPCGHGRISERLAARGMQVVGVDASQLFLDVAQTGGTSVDYRLGDLRDLPVEGPFAPPSRGSRRSGTSTTTATARCSTSTGGCSARRDGCSSRCTTATRSCARFTPAPFGVTEQVGDDLRIDTSEFDCVEGRMETDRLVLRDGQVRRSHHSVRVPCWSSPPPEPVVARARGHPPAGRCRTTPVTRTTTRVGPHVQRRAR